MTPAEAIRELDKALDAAGQTVALRKSNSAAGQATARAFVRGYKPEELVGLIMQGDKKIAVSPSDLATFGEPKAGQFVVINGRPHTIQGEPELIRMADVLVRVNMTARGV